MNSFRCVFGSFQYTIFGLPFTIWGGGGGYKVYLSASWSSSWAQLGHKVEIPRAQLGQKVTWGIDGANTTGAHLGHSRGKNVTQLGHGWGKKLLGHTWGKKVGAQLGQKVTWGTVKA